MPRSPRRSLLAFLLLAMLALAAGCAASEPSAAITPTVAPPSPTATTVAIVAEPAAPATAVTPTPTDEPEPATPEPTMTTVPPTATPTEEPQDLGLSAGAQRLAVALGPITSDITLHFERVTTADGDPAWSGRSSDGAILAEIIGPDDGAVTVSVAVLLPEGDAQAKQVAQEALYRAIAAAMPERSWAIDWLDERIEYALAGTPFSALHDGHYVQVVRLLSPQPCIHLAVTLSPETLSMPNWDRLGSPPIATVDAWDRLPIMPAPVRGQHLPSDVLDLYEYRVEATAQAALAFYEQEMPAAGWELVDQAVVGDPAHPEQDQMLLVYRRGDEGAIVTIDWLATMEQALVALIYAEDAADLPEIAG